MTHVKKVLREFHKNATPDIQQLVLYNNQQTSWESELIENLFNFDFVSQMLNIKGDVLMFMTIYNSAAMLYLIIIFLNSTNCLVSFFSVQITLLWAKLTITDLNLIVRHCIMR